MMGSLDYARRKLIVTTSRTKRSVAAQIDGASGEPGVNAPKGRYRGVDASKLHCGWPRTTP